MADLEVGQKAPSFRLPSGQGLDIGPEDYRGRSNLIIWFTKGMGCPFCRTQMSQLARGSARLKAAGTDVLQVTPTKPDRARFYVKNFPIVFPYLCDPDHAVHRAWGLGVRSHSVGWYAKNFYMAMTNPPPPAPADIGNPKTSLGEMPSILGDADMGIFVLDREGTIRYKYGGAYMTEQGVRGIPTIDELLRPLRA